MMTFAHRVVHLLVTATVLKGPEWRDEFSRVVDALPGLVWTALPDGASTSSINAGAKYTGLSVKEDPAVDEAYGRGWQRAIYPEDLPDSPSAGDPFGLPASQVK